MYNAVIWNARKEDDHTARRCEMIKRQKIITSPKATIQRQRKENGHWNNSKTPSDLITVEANSSTLCTDFVEITKANYPISMTTSRIRLKLSFNPQKLGYGYKEREKLVYILTVNTFLVNCQGSQMQMVYSFFSDISSGHKIIKSPSGQRITT